MEVTQDVSQGSRWNLATKILFRFFFIFLFLNIFPFPFYYISLIPGLENTFSFYYDWSNQLCIWTGKNILNISYDLPIGPNGSGDTTTNYVFHFIVIIFAFTGTIIWSIIDFKKTHYNRLMLLTRALVRYYLIMMMFTYGFSKAFTLQFSELSNLDLIKTFGDQSPMGLMWNFMEYSDTYTRFSGYAEILAGLLLIFRKTTLLGAIVTIGVMLNVFMMNLSYDIPVKLLSGLLTIMGLFLLAPDLKRILNFLVLNKETRPRLLQKYTSKPKLRLVLIVIKLLFIGHLFYTHISRSVERYQTYGKGSAKPSLYGIFEVKEFIKNKDTIPPLSTDSIRWKRLIVDKWHTHLQTMDEKLIRLKEQTDSVAKKITLTSYKDSTDIRSFIYTKKDSLYIFEGIYNQDTLKIKAKKKERSEFLLINRGFHWINERPFNR